MKAFSQAFLGVGVVLLSSLLVIGSIVLTMVEISMKYTTSPDRIELFGTPPPPASPQEAIKIILGQGSSPGEVVIEPGISLATQTIEMKCSYPQGWTMIVVGPDETLGSLAIKYGVPVEVLAQGNCLLVGSLYPGTELFVPPTQVAAAPPPAPKKTPRPCGPPAGWVIYIVKPGDNLFRIGLNTGATVAQLQLANCLGSSTIIRPGQRLYVPHLPVLSPTPSKAPTLTSTLPATATLSNSPTPSTTTQITSTLVPGYTSTPTTVFIPSKTPTPSVTPTSAIPTWTPTSTSTPFPMVTPSPTDTPMPTNTTMPTDTPFPTDTPVPTATPTSTETPRTRLPGYLPLSFGCGKISDYH